MAVRKFETIFGQRKTFAKRLELARKGSFALEPLTGPQGLKVQKALIDVDVKRELPALLVWREDLDASALPKVIALHQTTASPDDGMFEPAGFSGDPELAYALELAERGAAVVVPAYPLFSGYELDVDRVYDEWGYASMSQKGAVNHARAIDVLFACAGGPGRPVGCVGHSLGGSNGVFLGTVDPRCSAIVCSAGLSTFRSYDEQMDLGLAGWALRDKYMPLIVTRFACDLEKLPVDFDDIIVAASSAAQFISAPLHDDVFPSYGARDAVQSARDRVGSARIELVQPDCGHAFPEDVRRQAYDFLFEALGAKRH